MVRAAAWTAPAISLVVAAPAFAASNDPWTVTSASWEGGSGGVRWESTVYRMRFTINVPAGTTITAPTATLQFGTDPTTGQIRGGLDSAPSGWTSTTTDEFLGLYGKMVFTRGTITGPASVSLSFDLDWLFFSGSGTIGTITFTTSTAGQPSPSFSLLKSNAGASPGYITSPPA